MERAIKIKQDAYEKLEDLALEGLNSGEPITPDAAYWEAKHKRLEQFLRALDECPSSEPE